MDEMDRWLSVFDSSLDFVLPIFLDDCWPILHVRIAMGWCDARSVRGRWGVSSAERRGTSSVVYDATRCHRLTLPSPPLRSLISWRVA